MFGRMGGQRAKTFQGLGQAWIRKRKCYQFPHFVWSIFAGCFVAMPAIHHFSYVCLVFYARWKSVTGVHVLASER